MDYIWLIQNKEILKIFYGLIITLVCVAIVLRAHRLFLLSLYQGIRYFRNAFFFFGIAFFVRYVLGSFFNYFLISIFLTNIIFEFFIVMAGFFLLYSLLWKKIEIPGKHYISSLLNPIILLFYIMTMIIVFTDYIWQTFCLMFLSQIIIFLDTSIISYLNYKKNGKRHKFLKFYFLAMMLGLIVWAMNTITALFLNWDLRILFNVYIINMIIFLLFLYGVIKVTKIK